MSITALRGSVASSALFSSGVAEPWVLRSTNLFTGLALSNGGKTLTNVSAGDNINPGAWTDKTLYPTSPPVYWEVLVGTRGAAANTGYIGIASVLREATYNVGVNTLAGNTAFSSIGWREDGAIWFNGSSIISANSSRAYTAGDVLGFAFVPATGAFYLRRNGTWIINSDIIPNFGGIRCLLPAHGWKPFIHCRDQGDVATLRSTLAEFSGSVPDGFIPLAEAVGLTMDYIPVPLVNPGFEENTLTGWTTYSGTLSTVLGASNKLTYPAIQATTANNFFGQDVTLPPSTFEAIDAGVAEAIMSCLIEVVNAGSSRVQFEPEFYSASGVISSAQGPQTTYNDPIVGPVIQRFPIPAGTRRIRYRMRYTRIGNSIRMDQFALGISILPKVKVYSGQVHAVLGKPQSVVGIRHATLHAIIVP